MLFDYLTAAESVCEYHTQCERGQRKKLLTEQSRACKKYFYRTQRQYNMIFKEFLLNVWKYYKDIYKDNSVKLWIKMVERC